MSLSWHVFDTIKIQKSWWAHERNLQTVGMLLPPVDSGEHCTHGNFSVLFLLLLVEVALVIEVTEEDDEGDAVTKHQHVHGVGEVTLCKQVVARVQEEQQELQLERQSGKVRISRLHKHIVQVHSSFHTEQEPLTSCRDVRYRFHHRYFCMWGPMAATP